MFSYEGSLTDALNAVRVMRPGGTVVVDDCRSDRPDVCKSWQEVGDGVAGEARGAGPCNVWVGGTGRW